MDNTLQTKIQKLHPEDFPLLLKEITDPPEKLYLLGTLPPKDHKWLAVVGSRKYSNYGKEAAETLIAGLQGYPVVIVSGLALGIDAIAHRAALSAKLPTVAVPGSGLAPSVLYPSTNRNLAGDILKAGGALLSEFEPDFQATAWSFPQRNRVIAGLSDATLVVEAEQKSGALITSKFATEYNRDVFTVPGSIFSHRQQDRICSLSSAQRRLPRQETYWRRLGLRGVIKWNEITPTAQRKRKQSLGFCKVLYRATTL